MPRWFWPTVWILFGLSLSLHAQPARAVEDSLSRIVGSVQGRARIDTIHALIGEQVIIRSPDYAYRTIREAVNLAEELRYDAGLGRALLSRVLFHQIKSNFDSALRDAEQAREIFERLQEWDDLGEACMAIGNIQKDMGHLREALPYYLKALELYERSQLIQNKARAMGSIGLIYKNQKHYEEALGYFERSLRDIERIGDIGTMAITFSNMGSCYLEMGQYAKALEYYQQSLEIDTQLADEYGIAYDFFFIAQAYEKLGEHETALANARGALDLFEKFGDRRAATAGRILIGQMHSQLLHYEQGLSYLHSARLAAKQIGVKPLQREACIALHDTYKQMARYDEALKYYEEAVAVKDSIENYETSEAIARLSQKYNFEKARRENELLRQESKLKDRLTWLTGAAVVLLLIILAALYRNFRLSQASRTDLHAKNAEIEAKNLALTQGIRYAASIQRAMLNTQTPLSVFFPKSFIFFRPRDIVSGDFYWYSEHKHRHLIAAVDCTGHGVPGAFMTTIGFTMLNQIVVENHIDNPADILNFLNQQIIEMLHSDSDKEQGVAVNDGMDISLCLVDTHAKELIFSGANHHMMIAQHGQITEIKGERRGIGYSPDTIYENHRFAYRPGDSFYLYTDGYTDQFGGSQDKKFKIKQFRELIKAIHGLSPEQQHARVEQAIRDWMGDTPQTDDMLVIGIELS